ncbi:hypothetical protein [uncultured Caulobacter sp.]|uniref:hypothetical protein n=1 Tax=uncultured Caulobacter sp. TaxID=158749 RepID=UPI00262C180B|nr:hypothetical protein [uncultured Caulobacter sp.]
MRKIVLAAAVLAVSGLALAGCQKETKAPFDKGVCFYLAKNKDGSLRFNPVAHNVPQMEECAATLEGTRVRFQRLGMTTNSMIGSYQGSFIFIEKEGIYVGQTLEGPRYMSLVRTGDGRLAVPGAIRRVPAQ